jgi:alginate O-acetyltransferase complex protein AlgI
VIFFSFQIYFDFSGYSDMAIGLGKLFGFTFPENFNYPYVASSITDFWRRWHITLSSFFRDYMYIPLGGSRRGRIRTYLNLLIVWSATGIWHGAGINFLLWGLYFFLLLSAEKLFLHKILEKLPKFMRHGYALVAILFGWLIFAADGISLTKNTALTIARAMLFISAPLSSSYSLYELKKNLLPLIVMSAVSLPIFSRIGKRLVDTSACGRAISNFFCSGLFILCIAYLVSSGYNPFLYFRF